MSTNTPQAFLAKNKGRVKMYGDKTYLKEGDEFQIELFNPTTSPVEAKIKLNGKLISQRGIVIKPAQRIFLDRFIDVAKKFKFETYEAENTTEGLAAIVLNGVVEVLFYSENNLPNYKIRVTDGYTLGNYQVPNYMNNGLLTKTYLDPYQITYSVSNNLTNSSNQQNLDFSKILRSGTNTTGAFYSSTSTNLNAKATLDSLETGRIEQGSKSDQKFKEVDMNFNSYASTICKFQILPLSAKPATAEEVSVKFCNECGKKVKNNWKFCVSCGNKL